MSAHHLVCTYFSAYFWVALTATISAALLPIDTTGKPLVETAEEIVLDEDGVWALCAGRDKEQDANHKKDEVEEEPRDDRGVHSKDVESDRLLPRRAVQE